MLKIKLSRTGAKNHPYYRVVVARDTSKLSGANVDSLGYYAPLEKKFSLNKEKFTSWLAKGAQPTPSVTKLIESQLGNTQT